MRSTIKILGKRGLTLLLAVIMSVSLIVPESMADDDIDASDSTETEECTG